MLIYFIHSSFRQSRQRETTSTDRFSLERATSILFNRVGPERKKKHIIEGVQMENAINSVSE